jgi:hypothetical protein
VGSCHFDQYECRLETTSATVGSRCLSRCHPILPASLGEKHVQRRRSNLQSGLVVDPGTELPESPDVFSLGVERGNQGVAGEGCEVGVGGKARSGQRPFDLVDPLCPLPAA